MQIFIGSLKLICRLVVATSFIYLAVEILVHRRRNTSHRIKQAILKSFDTSSRKLDEAAGILEGWLRSNDSTETVTINETLTDAKMTLLEATDFVQRAMNHIR